MSQDSLGTKHIVEKSKTDAPFRGYLGTVITRKDQTFPVKTKRVQTVCKCFCAKRVDLPQPACVEENSMFPRVIPPQAIEQFVSRCTVKITLHYQMQIIAVSVNRDLEIVPHDDSSFLFMI
jgi:hypothetical protein